MTIPRHRPRAMPGPAGPIDSEQNRDLGSRMLEELKKAYGPRFVHEHLIRISQWMQTHDPCTRCGHGRFMHQRRMCDRLPIEGLVERTSVCCGPDMEAMVASFRGLQGAEPSYSQMQRMERTWICRCEGFIGFETPAPASITLGTKSDRLSVFRPHDPEAALKLMLRRAIAISKNDRATLAEIDALVLQTTFLGYLGNQPLTLGCIVDEAHAPVGWMQDGDMLVGDGEGFPAKEGSKPLRAVLFGHLLKDGE